MNPFTILENLSETNDLTPFIGNDLKLTINKGIDKGWKISDATDTFVITEHPYTYRFHILILDSVNTPGPAFHQSYSHLMSFEDEIDGKFLRALIQDVNFVYYGHEVAHLELYEEFDQFIYKFASAMETIHDSLDNLENDAEVFNVTTLNKDGI